MQPRLHRGRRDMMPRRLLPPVDSTSELLVVLGAAVAPSLVAAESLCWHGLNITRFAISAVYFYRRFSFQESLVFFAIVLLASWFLFG